MDAIVELQKMIDESQRIVFFGGAGVSTESGIPDFRSADGLFNMKYKYPPEEILSHRFFSEKPEVFYQFYKEKLDFSHVKPNAAHYKLAELEQAGKLLAVITQNIDGLHQMAGSRTVYELHGTLEQNYCVQCGRSYTVKEIPPYGDFPRCDCGGVIRPDVVFYGEPLCEEVISAALDAMVKADLLIIAGTSMKVYPSAGFVRYFRGRHTVMINKSATDADVRCDLVIRRPVGEVLSKIQVN